MCSKEAIIKVLEEKAEVILAYIYGSSVKGLAGSDSDLDLGILLSDEFDQDPLYPARVAREIEEQGKIGRGLDVRVLNSMPPRFLRQVIDGELVFSRSESERIRFESRVIDRYLDFKPFYEQYDRMRRERLIGEAR